MSDQIECSDCGEMFADSGGGERLPCPRCGGSRRTISLGASLTAHATLAGTLDVERGVNAARVGTLLALVGVSLGMGTSVGFAASAPLGVALGLATFIALAALLALVTHVGAVRRRAMGFSHFITRS